MLTNRIKSEQDHEGPHNATSVKTIQEKLGSLLEQEYVKWKQRAKINWYQFLTSKNKLVLIWGQKYQVLSCMCQLKEKT